MRVYFNGDIIRKSRKKLGLTQKELADKSKIVQANICRWENSVSTPSATQLALLSLLLDFDIFDAFIVRK